jgi:hypothetical protein
MLIWCSLKNLGVSNSRATGFRSFVSRAKREVVGGLLNNLYAKADLDQKEEISIFFNQNFARWAIYDKGPDNLWHGGNDAFRQDDILCV